VIDFFTWLIQQIAVKKDRRFFSAHQPLGERAPARSVLQAARLEDEPYTWFGWRWCRDARRVPTSSAEAGCTTLVAELPRTSSAGRLPVQGHPALETVIRSHCLATGGYHATA
jgi:hypothetical protein